MEKNKLNNGASCSCRPDEECNTSQSQDLSRRSFIKQAGIGAAILAVPGIPAFAGPFDENDYLKYIPADKKLDPKWVKALFERGEKEVYSATTALDHIGMPVGGLFAGTVYLSGDGRLWLWDIFNRDQEGIQPRTVELNGQNVRTRDGANFVEPAESHSPFKIGFELTIGKQSWALDSSGFSEIKFDGRYPMARISFNDSSCPVEVILEAFSPFIPLNADDSSLPATIMNYKIVNRSLKKLSCQIKGVFENPVCIDSAENNLGRLRNSKLSGKGFTGVLCEAVSFVEKQGDVREDILFEDFESGNYENWKTSGEAFGSKPVLISEVPGYQGKLGGKGSYVVNSHASAPGDDVSEKDGKTGTLTSPEFKITRKYIHLLIGGGAHKDKTCVNLIINGETIASITGKNNNAMAISGFNVAEYEGQIAHFQLVDEFKEGWGNIGIDHVCFSDTPPQSKDLKELRDFGSFSLVALSGQDVQAMPIKGEPQRDIFSSRSLTERPEALIVYSQDVDAGESADLDFIISWHFPNFYGRDFGGEKVGHYYASRFSSALDVTKYISANRDQLFGTTRKWVETWYDSSLPYWLLDRTMANTTTLATTTCYRHQDGRFWAWEGIGCCTGTCTHVWHYAQAVARLFPEIEKDQRERIDFGMALKANGEIGYRTLLNSSMGPAYDGQCGRILGAFREHLMSSDNSFLQTNWIGIKKALVYMIDQDLNLDGILEGSQPNTLDASWYGKISFISSLYISALRAGEHMAVEMEDHDFAKVCRKIAESGAANILELYNDEFFIQLEDAEHKDVIGVGTGCYIDQIFGQTWAHWLGMGHLFDRKKQLNALRSLYRYNFVPDIGPFRRHFKAGRWYAMEGDGGLLMCTWPKGGKRDKWEDQWQFMYFNECMSGFEWQAAAHMIYEGIDNPDILQNGLVVSKAIHDRYSAKLRNPYNEIECSDHYARAMASYGVFQAVSGFNYHGPKGILQFDPRLSPENFKSAFVCAEGWGSYSQRFNNGKAKISIHVKYGQLNLKKLIIRLPESYRISAAFVKIDDSKSSAETARREDHLLSIILDDIMVYQGQMLSIELA